MVYKNADTGFAVIEVTDDDGTELTAVGVLSMLEEGERVKLVGALTEHPTYGEQIKVERCESITPTDIVGIERYLGSGLVKGIGPHTAKLIVNHFGRDSLDVMLMTPHRLEEIAGIGAVRSAMIAESFREQHMMRDVMVFLQGHGVSPLFSVKIYKRYGDASKSIVLDNPYRLAEEIEGIGFLTADRIGRNLGIEKDDEKRLHAGLAYALDRARDFGHVCLPKEELLMKASELLSVDIAPLERALEQRLIANTLKKVENGGTDYIYTPQMLEAECYIARKLGGMSRMEHEKYMGMNTLIAEAESTLGIELAEAQKDAVRSALESPLSVITGGPGTGKTTILRAVLEILDYSNAEVLLAAPTGRAAKRMQEATGRDAKTVHRMLEYTNADGGAGYFNKNEDDPLSASVVIVDECSMIDVFLMNKLLRAIPGGCRLVLVGDHDQLPSVGPGNVLRDIISSGIADTVELTEIFRQASESLIILNAHRINRGQKPELFDRTRDFFFERHSNMRDTAQSVVDLCKSRLPGFTGCDAFSGIQVLAPMRKGEVGVNNLNVLLQQALNPPSPEKPEMTIGNAKFRLGDKIMQTRNNYMIEWTRGEETGEGVYNGDMGMIAAIDHDTKMMSVVLDDGRRVEYAFEDCDELEVAYAISVHKSQGSEYPVVVLPLCGGAPMLMTRNLLYTALTRAKKLVVITGNENSVYSMVTNNKIMKRYGCLQSRLEREKEQAT